MNPVRQILYSLTWLVTLPLLSACSAVGTTPNSLQPPLSAADTAKFIAVAKASACSDIRNRLFLIDQKNVFWERAGNCADASYARTLFGQTPETVLCSSADSIAGPRISCSDEAARALFATISQNLAQPDLGLGGAHQVQQIRLPPAQRIDPKGEKNPP